MSERSNSHRFVLIAALALSSRSAHSANHKTSRAPASPALQAHINAISPLLRLGPTFNPGAVAQTLSNRIDAPDATPEQMYAGLALMRALSDPERPAATPEMAALLSVAADDAQARRTIAATARDLERRLTTAGRVDPAQLSAWSASAFDGARSRTAAAEVSPAPARPTAAGLAHFRPHDPAPRRQVPVPGGAPSSDLPFTPTRALSLAQTTGRRMDTLLLRQAVDRAQAMLEVIVNGQDASRLNGQKGGRFGIGGLQLLGELTKPEDRVVLITSKGDGQETQFIFWAREGEVVYDYREVPSSRRGTSLRLRKRFTAVEVARRKSFLEHKLRANDRGPVEWSNGHRLNQPETFVEWGKPVPPTMADAPPVTVAFDESGYTIADSGIGMSTRDVFERYLQPYATDKPVKAIGDAARLLYRPSPRRVTSLGHTMVSIEDVDRADSRLNAADDAFIGLPHDADLTEERSNISLVPAGQNVDAALRGLRLLIDSLTDPNVGDRERYALINTLAQAIRAKQPAREKGLASGDPKTATDLLWYLRWRFGRSGLLEEGRRQGLAFLPNSRRWSPLVGRSDNVVFLDEDLFQPTQQDYATAGFEDLPPALTQDPRWKSLAGKTKARFFMRGLDAERGIAIVADDVIVVDKDVAESTSDPEVLIARLEREIKAPEPAPEQTRSPAKSRLARATSISWNPGRWLRPAIWTTAAAAIVGAAALIHQYWPQWSATPARPAISIDVSGNLGNEAPAARTSKNWTFNLFAKFSKADAARAQPRHPFGSFTPAVAGDRYFVQSIKTEFDERGNWKVKETPRSQSARPDVFASAQRELSYNLHLRGQPKRLIGDLSGRITQIEVRDKDGNVLPHSFDEYTDEISVAGYTGAASVRYKLEDRAGRFSIAANSELPPNEFLNMPPQWREALDPLRYEPDEDKVRGVEALMKRDFVYDASRTYARDSVSWTHTAQPYLDRHERIPIICNVSAAYYYVLGRYVGLQTAYAGLVNSHNGVFYQNLATHARVLVKVGDAWREVETTALMPLRVPAPDVDDSPRAISDEPTRTQGNVLADILFYGLGLLGVAALVKLNAWKYLNHPRLWLNFMFAPASPLELAHRWIDRRTVDFNFEYGPLGLLKQDSRRRRFSWGCAYFSETPMDRLVMQDLLGKFHPFRVSNHNFIETNDGGVLFANTTRLGPFSWTKVRAFDGKSARVLLSSPIDYFQLVRATGGEYALADGKLLRIEAKNGLVEAIAGVDGVESIKFVNHVAGCDRFAVVRKERSGEKSLGSFSVSQGRAHWTRRRHTLARVYNQWNVQPSALGDVFIFEYIYVSSAPSSPDRKFYVYAPDKEFFCQGEKDAKAVVVRDKVFISGKRDVTALDLATAAPVEAVTDGWSVYHLESLGDGLVYIHCSRTHDTGTENGTFLYDASADRFVQCSDSATAAVRDGGDVYWRPMRRPFLVGKIDSTGGRDHFSFSNAEFDVPRALARSTGRPREIFARLYPDAEKVKKLTVWPNPATFKKAVQDDRGYIERLPPDMRRAAADRAAVMPDWSLTRLFLSNERAKIPGIPLLKELDQFVRAHIDRPDWVRDVLSFVEFIDEAHDFARERVMRNYLRLVEVMPEAWRDVNRYVCEPAASAGATNPSPMLHLNDEDMAALSKSRLNVMTQVYLKMLWDGPEGLLPRQDDMGPENPTARWGGQGRSLGEILAKVRGLDASDLDAGGLSALDKGYDSAPSQSGEDHLSAARGAVFGQGITAPVWIRELFQNARDAAREALRAGRDVPQTVDVRSFLTSDGSRRIVSVRDRAGIGLGRILKYVLTPDATTKTAADAGIIGIGFFTVFGGGDEIIIRSGLNGRVIEVALEPVRDEAGRLLDVRERGIREYLDPRNLHQGTEVLRVQKASDSNLGQLLAENAYLRIMLSKYVGGVDDVEVLWNGERVNENMRSVGQTNGIASRLGSDWERWTVDQLYIQDPPKEGLALLPEEFQAALNAAGWNLDFPTSTPFVRTRKGLLDPGGWAPTAARASLPAAYELYRQGRFSPQGIPSHAAWVKTSPWDQTPLPEAVLEDAQRLRVAQSPDWTRYAHDDRAMAQLMLASCDDHERRLRAILGDVLCGKLDRLRARGALLNAGPLPDPGNPRYEETVRDIHVQALRAVDNAAAVPDPAALNVRRTLSYLAQYVEGAPRFIAFDASLGQAMRLCQETGAVVPLLDAFLRALGRDCDPHSIRLFENWIRARASADSLREMIGPGRIAATPKVLVELG